MKHLLIALLLLIVLVAWLAAPLQAVSTPAAPIVQVATPAATAAADDLTPRIDELKSLWLDHRASFNTDDGTWEVSSSSRDARFYDIGTYHVRVEETGTTSWSEGPFEAADFYLETTVYRAGGPADNAFGVVVRKVDNRNFYLFVVSSDGYYRMRKLVDNEWQTLVDWAGSDAIDTTENATNVIGVLAEGPQLSLLVNGILLATVDDDTYARGGLGVAASAFGEPGVEIAFEDFTVWQPGGDFIEVLTPEPSTAVTPTPEPEVDPEVLTEQVAALRLVDPDYTSDFRRASTEWPTVSAPDSSAEFADRAFVLTVDAPSLAIWSAGNATAQLELADFYMEADVAQEAGPADAESGLVVRYQDNENFYYFGITALDSFAFWKQVDNEWEVISDWRFSDAITAAGGGTTRLGVMAQSDRFSLFANDQFLAQVVDDTFAAGNVGFYAETHEEGGLRAAFDNIDVWKLAAEAVAPTAVPTEVVETPAPFNAESTIRRVDVIKADAATNTDDFRRDTSLWTTSSTDDYTIDYADQALRIKIGSPNTLVRSDGDLTLGDFLLEVDVTTAGGYADGQYGLFFRKVDEANHYFYAVNPAGNVGLWKNVDGTWHTLVDWTVTDLAVTDVGDMRRLGVLAEGPLITLLVDGTPVAQVEDFEFSVGSVALAAGTFAGERFEVAFDNLSVWEPNQ